MQNEKRNSISVLLAKESGVKKADELYVYLVGPEGKVVGREPIKEMRATLQSARNILEGQGKLYIAQRVPEQLEKRVNERMLIRAGAHQVAKNIQDGTVIVSRIPGTVLKPWHPGNCLITGNITNTVTVDGNEVTNPVCHARVHLVEVETELVLPRIPILYRRIPDWVINEIIQAIKALATPQIQNPEGSLSMAMEIASSQPSVRQKSSLPQSVNTKALPPLPQQMVSELTSASLDAARQIMADNHLLLHPYLCRWPKYWPWLYEWDEDNITYTDSNGHFEYWEDTTTEDGPLNIYTWVEVQINGQWVTVYHPAIPCHTRWNYPCGSSIDVHLHDSRITPCVTNAIPGEIVWIKRIGDGISIRNLVRKTGDGSKPSLFTDARGLASRGDVEGGSHVCPFSGTFPFYVQFGDGFPSASVTHFRWKYRRVANADLTAVVENFRYQEGTLSKYYTYQGTDAQGHTAFYTGKVALDVPNVLVDSGKIYKIPHVDASVDSGIPSAQWNQDTVSISVDALGLQNGLYEFVLELCNIGGVVKTLANEVYQIDSFQPSPPYAASASAKTVDPLYIVPNGAHAAGFSFLLRIDNDRTTCAINNAQVLNQNGTTATTDTTCGFAQYEAEPAGPANPDKLQPKAGDKMLLRFAASQPHRFARFDYSVRRGNSSYVVVEGGQVPEPVNTVFAGGAWLTYQYAPALGGLLGGCEKAAFAENLYLHAYHTNGTVRLDGYDSSDVAAFAVEPQP